MPNDFKTPEEQGHTERNDPSSKANVSTKASKEQETLFGRVGTAAPCGNTCGGGS
jgi:hypothetical protein